MTQLITTNNQQHVSNVTDDVGITLLHLSPNVIKLRSLLHLRPNVITLRSLLHLRAVITFRSSTCGTPFRAYLSRTLQNNKVKSQNIWF